MSAMVTEDIIGKIAQEIAAKHREILNEWCKAYLAHHYMENGKLPNPGSFTLVQRPMIEKFGTFPVFEGYTYTFEPNEDRMEITDEMKEKIDHPPHYKGNGLECIQVIEAFNLHFNLGNAVKYILRSGKKGSKEEDLRKAIWYLQRELESPED